MSDFESEVTEKCRLALEGSDWIFDKARINPFQSPSVVRITATYNGRVAGTLLGVDFVESVDPAGLSAYLTNQFDGLLERENDDQ